MSSIRAKQGTTEQGGDVLLPERAHIDQSAWSTLVEPYRGELLLHAYRLLGSLHDAEDAVQDAMLRAWRYFDTFTEKEPGSLRRWLYTIATNTSLDLLKKGSPRTLPTLAFPISDPAGPVAPGNTEIPWLEPFPDNGLAAMATDPETRYTRHESISLAFLTALQLLPPRQRAILLLSDVLDWRATEVADLLGISVSAVNSALHRARATLSKNYQREQSELRPFDRTNAAINTLLARYLKLWEADDVDGFVALLKEDATLSMPPVPSWYQGPEAIRSMLLAVLFPSGVRNRWRLSPTHANGQPAFAVYRADEATGLYRAFALQVVTLAEAPGNRWQIASITAFLDPTLVATFGFPLQLPDRR